MTNKLTTTGRWWMLWLTVGFLMWIGIFSIGKCSAQKVNSFAFYITSNDSVIGVVMYDTINTYEKSQKRIEHLRERIRKMPPEYHDGMALTNISQDDLGDVIIFSYSIDSGYFWKMHKEFQEKQQVYFYVNTNYTYFSEHIYIFSKDGKVSWSYGIPKYFDILPLYVIEITGYNNSITDIVERDHRGLGIQRPLSSGYVRDINTSMYEIGDTLVVDEYRAGYFRELRKGEKIKDGAFIGILNKTK